eukprot:363610-Chlamydomonas_euryale.AAC.11
MGGSMDQGGGWGAEWTIAEGGRQGEPRRRVGGIVDQGRGRKALCTRAEDEGVVDRGGAWAANGLSQGRLGARRCEDLHTSTSPTRPRPRTSASAGRPGAGGPRPAARRAAAAPRARGRRRRPSARRPWCGVRARRPVAELRPATRRAAGDACAHRLAGGADGGR